MKLDPDTIVAEAIAQLNEQGLSEVSLRKVAARLGVKAPSLSWHVGDKENLLGLMTATLFRGCVAAVGPRETWDDWLLSFGRELWRVHKTTRDAARLIAMAPVLPESLELIAEIETVLASLGAPPAACAKMQGSVQALVTGWTLFREGASGPSIEGRVHIDDAEEESLLALVRGWRAGVDGA